jgi:hypothetical protein
MSERIYEEVALIVKQKYTVRVLEFKEMGNEFTEISVYSKEVTEKNDAILDNFEFCFTVKGKGDEEKEKIEKMTEKEFEEFIKIMTRFIEKKYHIRHKREKKVEKKEEKKATKEAVVEDVENLTDFNIEWDPSLANDAKDDVS